MTKKHSELPLETDRLIIREISIDDAPFIFSLVNTPGWLKFIGSRNVNTINDAEDYIKNKIINSYEKNGYGFYLVMLRTGKIPIGICGFAKRDYLDSPDLGFAFLPEYEGFGYAYEAALVCMNYAVNVLNFKIITAITVRSNVRSIKLLEKLNMKYNKTISAPNDKEELLLFINHEN